MAVKEFANEATTSQRPENACNVASILLIIEKIRQDFEHGTDEPAGCRTIVNHLGRVQMPIASEIKTFKEKIQQVDQFLDTLCSRNNHFEIKTACLTELHKLIMRMDDPSPAAGIVLHRIVDEDIPETAKRLLLQSSYTSEEEIHRGVTTLMKWIPKAFFIKNLTNWIIGVMTGLCELKKYSLLMQIAEANIKNLIDCVKLPLYNVRVWPIILHMLAAIQHSPIIFNRLLALYANPNAMVYMPSDPQMAEQLNNTMCALIEQFPQKNNDILREKLRPTLNFRDSLAVPPWHDQNTILIRRRNANVRVGLINLGNTCYMNSVLQALMLSKQFTHDLLMADVRTSLFENMQRLLALLLHSHRPDLMPSAVLHSARPPGFHPGHEQDSSEFLGHLLDQLHEQESLKLATYAGSGVGSASGCPSVGHMPQPLCSMDLSDDGSEIGVPLSGNVAHAVGSADDDGADDDDDDDGACASSSAGDGADSLDRNANDDETGHHSNNARQHVSIPPAPGTVIQKSFGGVISITYKCLECQTESKQYDTFRDLHLSFPEPESSTPHSVQGLLDFYCSAERLDADNKYHCEQCKRLCVGERHISIASAPFSLILTLKHFKYDQKFNMRAKLMHKVHHDEFISVRLHNEIQSDAEQQQQQQQQQHETLLSYRLYAAVVHSGVSMETGHYFTYGTDASNGACYRFDDSHVSRTTVTELHNLQPPQTPYILFYQRVDNPQHAQQQQHSPTGRSQHSGSGLHHSPRKSPKLLASSSASSALSSATDAAGLAESRARITDIDVDNDDDDDDDVGSQRRLQQFQQHRRMQQQKQQQALITLADYPALEDLPPQLREYVNHDNILYSEETRSPTDEERNRRNNSSNVLARNYKNDSYRDDNDDDSNGGGGGGLGSCNTNFMPSYNQFIS